MKKTKIVCTIGPASWEVDTMEAMIDEGMNVARVNFSHGDYEGHARTIARIKEARRNKKAPIAIMLDTKGPEIRTGLLKDGEKVELKQGQAFTLTTDQSVVGDNTIVSVSYADLPDDLSPGDIVLIDDGLIALGVDEIKDGEIKCVVTNEGLLGEQKSINLPGISTNLPGLTDKDKADLLFGIEQGVDFVAASFVRKPQDVIAIRQILDTNGGSSIKIISKIESQEGVYNINRILEVSDGIMVARGDLGVEVPAQDVPIIQKKIIQKCNLAGKPVITATQMLDSMIRNPRPTRAEVADVANAVFDGTDAVMLSGETAAGEYPIQSVKTMAGIVEVAEVADEFKLALSLQKRERGVTNAVCEAAVSMSVNLDSPAIIAATAGGDTALSLSKYRPDALILATSFIEQTIRQLSLSWGVYGILIPQMSDSDRLARESVRAAIKEGWIKAGQKVIFAAGIPVGASSTTNMLRVVAVGESSIQGKGNGMDAVITGVAKEIRVPNKQAEENFFEGDILIIPRLTSENIYLAQQAGAIIIEADEEISKPLLDQIEGIPVITDVKNVFEGIRNGALITVNSKTGEISQRRYG